MFGFKRIIGSLFLAFLFIGGAWFLTRDKDAELGRVSGTDISNLEELKVDTDGDGLEDWEERLWKTDINNDDTDGDGVSDGEEVSLNRNPLVAGPDDLLETASSQEKPSIKNIIEDESLNLTEAFGRSVVTSYLSSKASGGSSLSQIETIGSILESKLPESPDFFFSDLNIITTSEPKHYWEYGNSFVNEVLAEQYTGEDILVILAKLIETRKESEINKIAPIVESLRLNKIALLGMTVPSGVAAQHLSFLNNLEAVRYDIEAMQQFFDDPLLAFLAISSYQNDSLKFEQSAVELKKAVQSYNPIFLPEDPGYKIFKK